MDLRVSYEIEESKDSPDRQLQRAVEHFIRESGEKTQSARKKKVKEEQKRSEISTLNKVMAQYLIEMS